MHSYPYPECVFNIERKRKRKRKCVFNMNANAFRALQKSDPADPKPANEKNNQTSRSKSFAFHLSYRKMKLRFPPATLD